MALSSYARLYIALATSLGLAIVSLAFGGWTSADPLRFLIYLVLTAIASAFKMSLPGITGTMSVSYILLLSCIIQLSFSEVVLIAVISALVQCFWKAKERPRLVHLSFNTSLMALSTAIAYWSYHAWPPYVNSVLPIASATCAYFLVNTALVAGVVAATERKPLIATWKNSYFWSFPYYLLGASIAALTSYVNRLNWEVSLAVLPIVFVIYRSYSLHLRQLEEGKKHAEAMASLHLRTIETLAVAIEAKDQTTANHLKRVQIYARELSKELGVSDDEKLALQAASILHDVGKIGVPDYIITKPGRLTPEEFEKMKIHPLVGAEIVEQIQFPYPVAPIVRAHHEKWDGSGYPFGLRDHQIPIGARILSVVDCFDALTSDRQYRKALPLTEAMNVVLSEAGKSFDPMVVELFQRRYSELEEMVKAEAAWEEPKLSLDVKIERGTSPGAGFESAAPFHENDRSEPLQPRASAVKDTRTSKAETFTASAPSSLSLTETLGVLCCRVSKLVPADAVTVHLLRGRTLVPEYVHGENFQVLTSLRIRLGQGVTGWVAENHRPILNGNPLVEPGYYPTPGASTLQSVLAIPLQTSSGTLGVLALYRAGKDAFSRDNLQDLSAVSDKIALTIESSLQRDGSQDVRNVDSITGLPNARALFSSIEAEIAKQQASDCTLTVLVCGLEGVAGVHDSFGRLGAEKALRLVASSFRNTCRELDYLARLGGDDFGFVLPNFPSEALAQRVDTLQDLVHKAGLELWAANLMSLSAGAATFPRDGDTPEALVSEAEQKMFAARGSKIQDAKFVSESLVNMNDSIQQPNRPSRSPSKRTESQVAAE